MPVLDNATIPTLQIPGITHQTIAGLEQGVRTMEVWVQRVAPGSVTPVHRHACEEVILVLSGSGRLIVEGQTSEFGPNHTIIVPADAVHQIIASDHEELQLVAALGMGPVRVRTAEGAPLPVPWQVG